MVVLVLLFLGSGFFKVEPQYRAIILRLGNRWARGRRRLLGPGLHWAFPRPIDEVEYDSVYLAANGGFLGGLVSDTRRARPGRAGAARGRSLNPAATSYALTADTNIIHVVATARYRITDPIAFHFDFTNAPMFITNDLNNALLFACSQMQIDDILT